MKTTTTKTDGRSTKTTQATHAIFKNDETKHKYFIHDLGINKVSLGLKDYPEIKQDNYICKSKLILI